MTAPIEVDVTTSPIEVTVTSEPPVEVTTALTGTFVEGGAGTPEALDYSSSPDIGEALADDDKFPVSNTSSGSSVVSALSRVWTYVLSKMPFASQAEMEAGTETSTRSMSPERVKQAIDALSSSGDLVDDLTPQLGGDLDLVTHSIVTTANRDITLTPNGTGNIVLGTVTLDADQTVGAGQDNFVLTYDNATGLLSLEEVAAGGDYADGGEAGGADRTLGNTDSFDLGFLTDNTTRLHVQSDGNVGIGTDSPQNLLDVNAGAVIGSSYAGVETAPTDGLLVEGNVGIGADSPGSKLTVEGTPTGVSYNRLIEGRASTAGAANAGTYCVSADLVAGATGDNIYTAGRFFNTVAGIGNDTSFWIGNANSGIIAAASSVTLGHNYGGRFTAYTARQNIGVEGSATVNKSSATNIGITGYGLNTSFGSTHIGGYFGLHSSIPTFTSAALIADNGSQTSPIFLARDNGSSVFSIIDGGNVGIGTASPDAPFNVDIDYSGVMARFTNADATYGPQFALNSTATNGTEYRLVSRPTGDFGIWHDSGDYRLYILKTGEMGIGTITPQNTFDINGEAVIGSSYAGVETAPTDGLLVEGNVGIGDTSPSFPLDVAGKIGQSGTQMVYNADADGFTSSAFYGNGGGSLSHTAGSEGYYNTGVGFSALLNNTTGYSNTANGFQALYSNTAGNNNTASGFQALRYNTTGNSNTANGMYSLLLNSSGAYNTAQGMYALRSNTTGSYNSAQGYQAGRYISGGVTANGTSSNSIYLGANTRALASGDTNEIVIGYNTTGIGSNTVTLGNDSIVTTALKGNVGIGTTSPSAKLHINNVTDANGTFNDGTNGFVISSTGNQELRFWVDETNNKVAIGSVEAGVSADRDLLLNPTGGNVGIGTTTPQNKLDVNGEAVIGSSYVGVETAPTDGLLIEGNVGIGTIAPDTLLDINGAVTQRPLSADPTDPDDGNSVQWVSDGTGSGDAGDVMMKITVGATTKTITVADFSAA